MIIYKQRVQLSTDNKTTTTTKTQSREQRVHKNYLHATMLAYLFLYLLAGFKNCWKENSSSGWTSCKKEKVYSLAG